MRILKTIEIGIDIQDCIGTIANPDLLKHILQNRYEKRCFKGVYIEKIESIRRVSDCMINQFGPPSYGTVSVICDVTAIEYMRGEILNGCIIQQRTEQGILICSTGVASIMMAAVPALDFLKKGQIISVRVGIAKYANGSDKISVNAAPFTFGTSTTVYKVALSPSITASDREILTDVNARIAFEEKEAILQKKTNPTAWKFFDDLFYAYKVTQKVADTVNISQLATMAAMPLFISRDTRLPMSQPIAAVYSNTDDIPVGSHVRTDLPPIAVIIVILEDYCEHLRLIRELITIYSTEDLLVSHKLLWKHYNNMKY